MVMDATQPQQPSPQSVGREFVRQYYTLLNKAPNHLHRFYNHQSSFVHGESTLVIGQKNIYTRIQQLNFHDCHAKISQVDAQATLGNGVVVQVTGELSNDGQPMRRFTQTFVLASQSPKKYYVHNDIFRYQDMYTDDENDVESSRSEHDVDDIDQVVNNDNQLTVTSGGILVEQPSQPPQPQQQQQQQTLLPQQQQQQQQPLAAPVAVATAAAGVLPQQQQQAAVVPAQQQPIYYAIPPNAAAGGRAPPMQVMNATAPGQVAPLAGTGAPQYSAAATTGVVPSQAGGINHQLNGVAGVTGSHDDILQQQQQQQQQPQSANIVTNANSAPVPTVLAAQNATIPVANAAAIPQNNAGQISAYQQTQLAVLPQQPQQQAQQQQVPLMQQPQQQQQHHQQNVNNNNVHTPQAANQQHAATSTGNEISENVTATYGSNVVPSPPEPTPIVVDDFKTINEQQQQEKYEAVKQQQHQLQNEPKTYANLFKTTTSSPSGFVNAAMQQQQQYQQQQQQQHHQQHISNNTNNSYQGQNNSNTSTYAQNNGNNRYNDRNNDNGRIDNSNILSGQQGSMPQRQNSRMKDFDQRRTSNAFSDNLQLFLGNIPHHASEDELKKMFQQFGHVLELRILSKPGGKSMPGTRNPLNYGFITYEDPESVQNCLAHCPIYFPENSPDGQKLNVEEKKPRSRDLPPRQGGVGMGNNINNMNNNQRNMSGSVGGPQSRSLSGGGNGSSLSGVLRGNSNVGSGGGGNNNMPRGGTSGGRIGGYRSGASNGNSISSGGGASQLRGGSNNSSTNSQQSGGGNYSNRR